MSILVLNRIGLRHIPYHDYLAEVAKSKVVLLTDATKVPAGELEAYRERYLRVELIDAYETSGLLELRADALHREHAFTRIVAVSEFDLMRAARLRERWGIEGQGYASALAFRDKAHMKEISGGQGIRVPAFRRIDTAVDVIDFVETHGYPVVVKPLRGSGAVATSVVKDAVELKAVLASNVAPAEGTASFEVEQFVSGQLYHIDGILENGKPALCWPSSYVNECHNFASGKVLGSYQLERTNPLAARLVAFAHELLAAMPTPRDGAFHIEAFHTPKDEIVLCEVASRVGGPRIPDAFEVGFGVSLARTFVRSLAGLPLQLAQASERQVPGKLGGFLLIPARAGVLTKAPPTACPLPGVLDFFMLQELGSPGEAALEPTDFVATFVFEAANESDMRAQLDEAVRWFEANASWEPAAPKA